jgi:outer membrane protein assembly factor BamB
LSTVCHQVVALVDRLSIVGRRAGGRVLGGSASRQRLTALCAALTVALGLLTIGASTAFGDLTEQSEIIGPGTNGSAFGGNGTGLSLSADGNTALIGEPNKGGAFVYTRSGTAWSQQAKLVPPHSGEHSGYSVALSADGNTAIASAYGGGAWVYTRSGTGWTLQTEEPLVAGEAKGEGMSAFGSAVAISSDGTTTVIGAICRYEEGFLKEQKSACAYVFKRSGSRWSRVAMLKPAGETISHYSEPVSPATATISGDGRTVLFGNPYDGGGPGGAWIFEEAGGAWTERTKLVPGEETGPGRFGGSVSLSRDGTTAIVGASYDAYGGGGAWAFTRSEAGWRQQGQELIPPLEPLSGGFGTSVALSANGTAALIGGPNNDFPDKFPGAAWLFRRSGERWWLEQKLPEPVLHREARTGTSVAVSDEATTALVASPGQGTEGAVWVFTGPAAPGVEMPPAPPAVPAGGQWAQLGGNPARTATVDSPSLHPPFTTVWSHALAVPPGTRPTESEVNGEIIYGPQPEEVAGYPLLGNGLVYVVRTNTGWPPRTELDAFSQKTGALVWNYELHSGGNVFTALDGNRLFVSAGLFEGVMAFDALSGQKLWEREVEGREPIVATEGTLYYIEAFIGAETVAVDETTGRTKWEAGMFNSTGAGPVIGDGRVYVMGDAEQGRGPHENGVSGWAFDEKTGKKLWEDAPEALGDRGDSWTAVLAEGRLWTAGSGNLTEYNEWSRGAIVDPATGARLGNYDSMNSNSPIIDGEDVIGLAEHWKCGIYPAPCTLQNTTLTSKDAGGTVLWTFEGDGRLDSGLVRIGEDVLVGSASGNLYAVDERTGNEVWKAGMPAGFRPENLNGMGTPTGMAANGNMLAVVTGGTLTMMTSGGTPTEPTAPGGPGEPTPPGGPATSGTPTETPAHSSSSGGSSTGGGAPQPGSGGAAGTRTSFAPACVLSAKPAERLLRGGALRLSVRVRCSSAGTLSLLAGYRSHASRRHARVLVTLALARARVRRGADLIKMTLTPAAAHSLKAARAALILRLALRPTP